MYLYVLFVALPLLFVVLLMPRLIDFLARRNVADVPGGRKIHTRYTPSLGGAVVYAAFASCLLASSLLGLLQVNYLFMTLLSVLCLVGVVDDLLPVRASYKMAVQVGVSVLFCLLMGERITAIYGFEQLLALPSWVQCILTVVAMVGITNAYNLSDGIDGLAGSIAVSALAFLSFWFHGVGDQLWTLMCLGMLSAVIGFLAFNWSPAKIFLGDTGSLVVGFFLASAIVHLMEVNARLPDGNVWKHPASIALGAVLVVYPLFDTLRVFYLRIRRGQSPFTPDKRHLHHLMLRSGLSHRKITLAVVVFSIGLQSIVLLFGLTASVYLPLGALLVGCLLFFGWVRVRLLHFMDNRPPFEPSLHSKHRSVERKLPVRRVVEAPEEIVKTRF